MRAARYLTFHNDASGAIARFVQSLAAGIVIHQRAICAVSKDQKDLKLFRNFAQ